MLTGALAGCGKSNTLDGTQTVAVMDELRENGNVHEVMIVQP